MMIIRGDEFIKEGDDIYIVGSPSNYFYQLTTDAMGPVSILGWVIDKGSYNLAHLEKYTPNSKMKLVIYPASISLFSKIKIISGAVRHADCVTVKTPLPNSIIACLFAWIYRIPFVLESGADSFASLWYHGGFKHKIMAWPIDLIVKFEHRIAKHIIYVSKYFLQKKYPSKARQMGCPDTVLKLPGELVLQQRLERISHHAGPYVLGLMGETHVEYRGHDRLIQAMAILKGRGYDVCTRFLGGGLGDDQRKQTAIKYGVEDRVEFCGRIKHDDVFRWIDDIDVLVMPTMAESLGRAVIEAMSRGCPVIGSIETAIKEQIGSDCLIHARNVKEIADAIEYMILHQEYATLCAYENFYRAKKYDSDITFARRKSFYDRFYQIEGLK